MYHTALFTVCSILYGLRGGHFESTGQAISIYEALVLRSSNIGCRYGNNYMSVYCYADDIGLLSPSLSGLKKC